MEFIKPAKQAAWGWPAAANFILGGMGASFYLLSLWARIHGGAPAVSNHGEIFKIVGPGLTILGLALLGLEAGRPLRSRFLLKQLGQSWMSRETLAAALFIGFALLDFYSPQPAALFAASLGALFFLVSQSFIIFRSRGISAWNVPLVPVIFLASALSSGSGLLLLDSTRNRVVPGGFAVTLTLALLLTNLLLWLFYLKGHRSPESSRGGGTKSLLRPASLLLTVGIGQLLPGILLLTLVAKPEGADQATVLLTAAGCAVVLGAAAQKAAILLKAGYLRGIAIGR